MRAVQESGNFVRVERMNGKGAHAVPVRLSAEKAFAIAHPAKNRATLRWRGLLIPDVRALAKKPVPSHDDTGSCFTRPFPGLG